MLMVDAIVQVRIAALDHNVILGLGKVTGVAGQSRDHTEWARRPSCRASAKS